MTKNSRRFNSFMPILMQNPYYCLILIGVFALTPFTNWLSMTLAALCTLRLNGYIGLQGFGVATLVSFCILAYNSADYGMYFLVISSYLLCFVIAMMLRNDLTWKVISNFLVILALTITVIAHLLMHDYIILSMQNIVDAIVKLDGNSQLAILSNSQYKSDLAHYFWSIRTSAFMLGPLLSVLFARSIQSQLYYPGGFRIEIYQFHAEPLYVLFFLLTLVGIYFKNIYAISFMPILYFYLLMMGILFVFRLLQNQKKWISGLVVVLPLFFIPYIFLIVYAIFGIVDGLKQTTIFKRL